MSVRILQGEVTAMLRTLEAESVDCVVTSPPYWGLRSYLPDDHADKHLEIGCEPSLAEHLAVLVGVFAEVRRVMKPAGVVFLNYGDCYATTVNGRSAALTKAAGQDDRTFRDKPFSTIGPIYDALHEPSCGTDDKAQSDFLLNDPSSESLCDVCREILTAAGTPHTTRLHAAEPAPLPSLSSRESTVSARAHSPTLDYSGRADHMTAATQGSQRGPSRSSEIPRASQASTMRQFSAQSPGECCHCANCGACLSVLRSSTRDARLCVRKFHGASETRHCIRDSEGGPSSLESDSPNMRATGSSGETSAQFISPVLKAKDLCMVANRLAIALQNDGWWVRSEIVWGKNNPMPDSSGKYRPSTAHEKIFLLTKSAKSYYDAEAVALPCSAATHARLAQDVQNQIGSERANGGGKTNGNMKAVRRKDTQDAARPSGSRPHSLSKFEAKKIDEAVKKQDGHGRRHAGFNERWDRKMAESGSGIRNNESMDAALAIMPETRYLRNYEPAPLKVWEMSTQPFSEAHFATFPPELVERALLAGCPHGGIVLDPFGGAGTTGLVADRMGLDAILIELNPASNEIARNRISNDCPMFAEVAAQ